MAKSRASTLFHFTKSLDTVTGILLNGFIPHYSLEDTSWLGSTTAEFISFPMVCFCDIPIGRISEHVGFYGSYGIGMSRDWAIRNGVNPVAYYSRPAPICEMVLAAVRKAQDLYKVDPKDKTQECLHSMLAYAKPVDGTMMVQSNPVMKDFYLESEWRFVPSIRDFIFPVSKATFDNPSKRDLLVKRSLASPLKFVPADVRYIFVKQDADIPPLIDFINAKLQNYSAVDLKILFSRITSLEHLDKDI